MNLRKKYYLTLPNGEVYSFTSINLLLNMMNIPFEDKQEIVKPFRAKSFEKKEDKVFVYEKLNIKIEYRY